MLRPLFAFAFAALTGAGTLAKPANMLENADFGAALAGWTPFGSQNGHAVDNGMLRFTPDPSADNAHLDQTPELQANTIYRASVEIRAEGHGLAPSLRIAGMDWSTIAEASAPADGEWHTVETLFLSSGLDQIRYQLFGAGRGRKGTDASGKTWFRNPILRPGKEEDRAVFFSARVTVDPTVQGPTVNPLFFGVNSLFWITDDEARADGKIAGHLRDMGCTLVRFPGGEVADNYHWRTNRLDDIRHFPFQEGPDEMDFDEFMAWLGTIGAQPICVVNLESGFLRGDPEAGVTEAAEWVRYANVTKGYGVKYWEIGNETDLAGTRYPLTAEQYGQAVRRFSAAMKAVDPTIQVGALGPFSPAHAAPIDRLTPDLRRELQALPAGERRNRMKTLTLEKEGPAWWPTVCRIAGEHFDFAIVHRYDNTRRAFPNVGIRPLALTAPCRELGDDLRQRLGREIPLALTEWNVWRNAAELGALGHALTIGEQVGNYLAGGVAMANYWPMRYPRGKAKDEFFRGLLDQESKEPRAVFHVLKLFREHAVGHVVPVATDNPNLYAFATRNTASGTLVLINRLGLGEGVQTRVSFPDARTATAQVLVGADTDPGVRVEELRVERREDAWHVLLPAHSLAILRFAAVPTGTPPRP